MTRIHFGWAGFVASTLILFQPAAATTLSPLSFEQLTDTSEMVVTGTVTRSWTAFDAEHKYIWTHYEVSIETSLKGKASHSVEVAELGGSAEGMGMNVPGTVVYQPGERVLIFLARQPNGFLRTTGWGQGKYTVDAGNRLHGDASLRQVDFAKTGSSGSTRSLEGLTLTEVSQRIAARVRARSQEAK